MARDARRWGASITTALLLIAGGRGGGGLGGHSIGVAYTGTAPDTVGKVYPMSEIIITVALGIATFCTVVVSAWRLNDLIVGKTNMLHDTGAAQARRLAIVAAELQYARKEILRLQSEVTSVRAQLEGFIHGPPSIGPGSQQIS